jgi:magnesium chelatase family protein
MVASLNTWAWADGRWHSLRVDVAAASGFSFHMVGTRDPTVREAPSRIHAAFMASGYKWPGKRITVSFQPTRPWTLGTSMDLPIALGVLMASGQIPMRFAAVALGTLDLNGVVSMAESDRPAPPNTTDDPFVYPASAWWRPAGPHWVPAASLAHAIAYLSHGEVPELTNEALRPPRPEPWPDLKFHPDVVVALGLAAAGKHPVFLWGPPGVGKTEFAKAVHRLRATSEPNLPFVEPGSFLSPVQLVGAHGAFWAAGSGVLFLDELGERPVRSLEVLRKPMEALWSREGAIAPQTIGATNPCPCGFSGHKQLNCSCSEARKDKYLARYSGPFLDRFQIGIPLSVPEHAISVPWEEMSYKMKRAVELQKSRGPWLGNAGIPLEALGTYGEFSQEAHDAVQEWHRKSGYGLRTMHHTMRVARTAADWADRVRVTPQDIWLAISLIPMRLRPTSTFGLLGPERSLST